MQTSLDQGHILNADHRTDVLDLGTRPPEEGTAMPVQPKNGDVRNGAGGKIEIYRYPPGVWEKDEPQHDALDAPPADEDPDATP